MKLLLQGILLGVMLAFGCFAVLFSMVQIIKIFINL